MEEPTTTRTAQSTRQPKQRRKRLFRVVGLFIGLLAGWGVAEGWLAFSTPHLRTKRVLLNSHDPSTIYHCYSSNPNGEFSPVPEVSLDWFLTDFMLQPRLLSLSQLSETPYCIKMRFSPEKFRDDRIYTKISEPDVLRIAVVGDSFVAGEGVPLHLTLPRQLEGILNEGFEVMSAGRSGYDTHKEVQLLEQVAANYHCRRAILVFIANDVRLTPQLNSRQTFINDLINIRDRYLETHNRHAWYRGHSRVLELIGTTLEMKQIESETVQWYLDSYNENINGQNLELLQADLDQIAKISDCRVAFVMYPLLIGLEGEYPLQKIHDKVGKMAHKAGLPVLDLAPTFRGIKTSSLQAHPTDHHPNGKAHAIAAKAIIQWLRQDVPGFLELDDEETPPPKQKSKL